MNPETPEAMPAAPSDPGRAFAWGLKATLFLLGWRFAAFVVALFFLLPLRMDVTFPEGAVVARAWDVAHGRPAYQDWREWPHRFAPYGPLTYHPVGWATRLVSPSATPWDVYFAGRVQSFAGLAAAAALVFVIGRGLGMGWGWCAAPLFLWAAWDQVFSYVASYRPDAPQAAFSLAALAVMLRRRPTLPALALVFGLLSCAMWFKPVAWGMTVAAGIWAGSGGVRRGGAAVILFGAANLAAAVALNQVMDGRLFLNMIASLDNGFHPLNVPGFYAVTSYECLVLFIAGAAGAFIMARTPAAGDESDRTQRLFVLAVFASWVGSTLQNFKEGADVNYYLEPYILLACCAAWGLRFLMLDPLEANRRAGRLVVLGAFAWAFWGVGYSMTGYLDFLRSLRMSWGETSIEQYVSSQVRGEIFTTNPFVALVHPDRPALMDMYQFDVLVRRGKLDPEGLLGRMRSGRFEKVVLSAKDWSEPREDFICRGFNEAVRAAYEIERDFGAFVILRRRAEGAK